MKKLTLNQTWRKCLKMWKWIVEHLDEDKSVCDLKTDYLLLKTRESPTNDCYFCEWLGQNVYGDVDEPCASFCPGVLVNSRFNCCAKTYHYEYKPRAFYRKLLELDKKRKAK